MKKTLAIAFTAIIMSLSAFAYERPFTIKKATHMLDEELMTIFNGEDPHTIIKFSSGDTFPLNFNFVSEFFSLNVPDDTSYFISVKRDLLICVPEKEKFLFSLDGNTWKTFTDIATGDFHVGFSQSPEPCVSIGGHLYEKKNKNCIK